MSKYERTHTNKQNSLQKNINIYKY